MTAITLHSSRIGSLALLRKGTDALTSGVTSVYDDYTAGVSKKLD